MAAYASITQVKIQKRVMFNVIVGNKIVKRSFASSDNDLRKRLQKLLG